MKIKKIEKIEDFSSYGATIEEAFEESRKLWKRALAGSESLKEYLDHCKRSQETYSLLSAPYNERKSTERYNLYQESLNCSIEQFFDDYMIIPCMVTGKNIKFSEGLYEMSFYHDHVQKKGFLSTEGLNLLKLQIDQLSQN
jgi:hypothetical protein